MSSLTIILQVTVLVIGSGVCSGLNVSIMSLDLGDLERKAKLGDVSAKKVLPLRKNAHLTLAAILLTKVAFASASSIVLAGYMNGFVAALISTLLLVFFGELLPQALFTRHALSFCAFFSGFLKLITVLTYPIAKPLQIILDRWFGNEKNRLNSRHELSLLEGEHIEHIESELDEDEIVIIRGALMLSEKKVESIMTPLKHTYWLSLNDIIDGHKIDEIKARGWSRIPIINNNFKTCYGVLLQKDLVDIGFDENPVDLRKFKLHKTKSVGAKTALETVFRHFISARGHMMVVYE